jgi:hypothetical protein
MLYSEPLFNQLTSFADVASVGTECTLVHCSLYTGCIYRVLTPRELKNQVVNLQNIATASFGDVRHVRSLEM